MVEEPVKPKQIKPEFLSLLNYSMCVAIAKHAGEETAQKIYEEMGEIMFEELKKELGITSTYPLTYFNQLARYLEDVGYMAKMEIKKVKENEFIMDGYGISVADVPARLEIENVRPYSHFMTNLMFAALKKQSNMKAELRMPSEMFRRLKKLKHGTEIWVLSKIE